MASILKPHSNAAVSISAKTSSGLSSFNLQDLAEVGRRQLEAAEQEAARIIAAAKAEAEALKAQATHEARQQGLAAAQQDLKRQVNEAAAKMSEADLAALRDATQQLYRHEAEWLKQWSDCLVGLVSEISSRIIGHRAGKDEQILVDWAQQAIQQAKTSRSITIAVHPETLIRIGERLEQLLKSDGAPEDSRIEPDETVSKTGVVLRREGGQIDFQLQTQLERIVERLK